MARATLHLHIFCACSVVAVFLFFWNNTCHLEHQLRWTPLENLQSVCSEIHGPKLTFICPFVRGREVEEGMLYLSETISSVGGQDIAARRDSCESDGSRCEQQEGSTCVNLLDLRRSSRVVANLPRSSPLKIDIQNRTRARPSRGQRISSCQRRLKDRRECTRITWRIVIQAQPLWHVGSR